MTDTNTNPTSNPATDAPTNSGSNRTPTHAAYHVRDFAGSKGKKGIWTRIGTAWAHGDGQGFNVQIECLPLDGRISLRIISEKREQP